jgi:hypothetical protein
MLAREACGDVRGWARQGGSGRGSPERQVIVEAAVQVGRDDILRQRRTSMDGDGRWQVLELTEGGCRWWRCGGIRRWGWQNLTAGCIIDNAVQWGR